MRKNPNLIVPHRRHREGRTDYHLRLELLKSREPRLVVRKSLNNFTCQLVKFEEKGDKIVASAVSSELRDFGWKFHGGNMPAAYLTGLLCAERAKRHKISKAILDIGLYSITQGNSLFSALKGAVDGGLEVPHAEEAIPPAERISGRHISDYAEKLRSDDPEKYKKLFSAYLKEKADPKDMPAMFEATKKMIIETKGEKAKRAHKAAEHKPEHKTEKKAEHEHKHEEAKEHKHTEAKEHVHHEHKAEHAKHEHKAAHEHKTEHAHHKKE